MTAPTAKNRELMYERDQFCCAACGLTYQLTHQHRRATGAGGSKERPTLDDSLTLCATCNWKAEADAKFQRLALINGWKVRKWVDDPGLVPVFYSFEQAWYRLEGPRRVWIPAVVALDMMHAVYGEQYLEWRNS
ncbi:hypothetical protein GCM10009775_04430 [Microbacterium aoyamense]|uniref:HNH endonuclease n=1 Tax=Microbacterium aoyamense TaxID=344166 RepID=A0ABN2P8B0_9MICO|nr:hypothetical protein [Microbacterium aoyamense]